MIPERIIFVSRGITVHVEDCNKGIKKMCASSWTKIDYQDKHCVTDQTDKGTQDNQGRDGRTNFTWRIKEQATRLTPLFEHDDDDDDDNLE